MKVLRIGPAGSGKPGALVDDKNHVHLSDVVEDFDERFFGSGGLDRIRPLVASRIANRKAIHQLDAHRIGAPIARRQNGSTSMMIFDPYFIVYYLSQFLVLEPGNVNNTGTPPGVGAGFTAAIWLQAGDVVERGVDGLGQQRRRVLPPP